MILRRSKLTCFSVATLSIVLLLVASFASADEIVLDTGERIEGDVVPYGSTDDAIVVRTKVGGTRQVKPKEIDSVVVRLPGGGTRHLVRREEIAEWIETSSKHAREATRRQADEAARREADEKARREAEENARRGAEEKARREAEEKSRRETEERARREAEEKSRRDAEAQMEAEARAQREAADRERAHHEADAFIEKAAHDDEFPLVILPLVGMGALFVIFLVGVFLVLRPKRRPVRGASGGQTRDPARAASTAVFLLLAGAFFVYLGYSSGSLLCLLISVIGSIWLLVYATLKQYSGGAG